MIPITERDDETGRAKTDNPKDNIMRLTKDETNTINQIRGKTIDILINDDIPYNPTFDPYGKSILKQLLPYMDNFPFKFTNIQLVMTERSIDTIRVETICRRCEASFKFRILTTTTQTNRNDKPFLFGMNALNAFYTNHIKTNVEECKIIFPFE